MRFPSASPWVSPVPRTTTDLTQYKQAKKAKLVAKRLREMLEVFQLFEVQLQPYRFYVPAQEVLASISSNRTFAKLALKRMEDATHVKTTK